MTNIIACLAAIAMTVSCAIQPQTDGDISLSGKSLVLVGDSICYGTNYHGGYGKFFSEDKNMTVTNLAKGGAALARGAKWDGDGEGVRPSIIDMVESIEQGSDYIVIEGGVNDFWNHVPLGVLTDGADGGYDDTTFAGALETIFFEVTKKHSGSKIGYVIIHDPFTYNAEEGFEPYYNMIKSACEKWGIPYLDLYAANNAFAGVNVKDEEQKRLYFETENAPNGDGCHPNETGYREIYVKPMTPWLKSL